MLNRKALIIMTVYAGSVLGEAMSYAGGHEADYVWFDQIEGLLSQPKTRAQGVRKLETKFPGFYQSVQKANALSKRRWEASWNYDEYAKAEIVKPNVLKALNIPMAESGGKGTQSAGVMHTYGYLFSILQTPYGRKGKRWIEGEIDQRLGLEEKQLSVQPKKGEFLGNLTQILDRLSLNAEYRLEEISLKKGQLIASQWNVATFLVPFLKPNSDPQNRETHLLFYGAKRSKVSRMWSWVTAFPVTDEMAQSIRKVSNPEPLKEPYSPRFNWNPRLEVGETLELNRVSYREAGTKR